jgi:hypothetical protein
VAPAGRDRRDAGHFDRELVAAVIGWTPPDVIMLVFLVGIFVILAIIAWRD